MKLNVNPKTLNKTYWYDGVRQIAKFKGIYVDDNCYIFVYDFKLGKDYGRLEISAGETQDYCGDDQIDKYVKRFQKMEMEEFVRILQSFLKIGVKQISKDQYKNPILSLVIDN